MRRFLALLLLPLAACSTTTADYVRGLEGFDMHSGYVYSTTISSPQVEKLADGTVYTATEAGGTVVLYTEERTQFGKERRERSYELKPGDKFINARPLSYVLIRR